ncbi:MAG: methylmalonyl-CoA epimerase [Candidatus Rokubacteria bacterium]|nr:methylmalonyl-CoA epimerase [Candidatus Rokubacteria bacterium]
MIKGIHHVGVAVRSLKDACGFWRDTLGLPLIREAELPDQGVRAALLACGSCEVELLEPTGPDTPVGRFIERRGPRLHHLCFQSDDVGRDVQRFWGTGVEMIDTKPRKGLVGMIAFVHPRSTAGILVELATPPASAKLPESPVAVTVAHLIVEDVRTAVYLFRDMFGLPIRISHPDWSIAQLAAAAGVALQFGSTTTTAGKPGLSMLRMMSRSLDFVGARLDARGLSYRRDAVGIVLGPDPTGGVPLIIHQPQA